VTRLYLLAATLNAWVLIAILAAAMVVQFGLGEPPCPLCIMQRIALMLVGLGPIHILLNARGGALTARAAAVGQGMAIIAALLGAIAAGRQLLLHILPGDPGFGSPVLGLHLYTWCFVAFGCQIAASAVLLIAGAWLEDGKAAWPLTGITVVAFAAIVAANLLSVIAEAGFNWDLPSDPVGYLLFK
jgi:disulfide bond formation protein DsbB